MNIAKKTIITNTAKQSLGVDTNILEDAIVELHQKDKDGFAVGDIKLTTREIDDSDWAKCDGSPMTHSTTSETKQAATKKLNIVATENSYTNSSQDKFYINVASQQEILRITVSGNQLILYRYAYNDYGEITATSSTVIATCSSNESISIVGNGILKGNLPIYIFYRITENNIGDIYCYAFNNNYTTTTNVTANFNGTKTFYDIVTYAKGYNVVIDAKTTNTTSATLYSFRWTFATNLTPTTAINIQTQSISNWSGTVVFTAGDVIIKMNSGVVTHYKTQYIDNWVPISNLNAGIPNIIWYNGSEFWAYYDNNVTSQGTTPGTIKISPTLGGLTAPTETLTVPADVNAVFYRRQFGGGYVASKTIGTDGIFIFISSVYGQSYALAVYINRDNCIKKELTPIGDGVTVSLYPYAFDMYRTNNNIIMLTSALPIINIDGCDAYMKIK